MNFCFLINSCYLFKDLMNFLDSWIFDVVLDKIFNKICRLIYSRESVRIALTLAVLNNLEVKTSDIQNAYLTASCSEKVHTTLGTKFGENKGKTAIIVEEELNKIDKFFKMKAGSIGDPDINLGAKDKPMKMNNGVAAWAISPSKYVNEAVNNCEKWVQENMPGHKKGSRATNPFPRDYDPDLDTTDKLGED